MQSAGQEGDHQLSCGKLCRKFGYDHGFFRRVDRGRNSGRLILKEEGTTSFANVKGNGYLEAADGGLKPSVLNYTIDKKAKLKYTYTYDDNRKHVTRVTVANTDNNAVKYVKNISYDGYDRVTTESYGDIAYIYTREDGNNSPDEKIRTASTLSLPYQHDSIYSYDGLNRITQKQTVRRYWSMYPINGTSQHVFYQTYNYHAGKSGTNETTGLIKNEELYLRYSRSPTEQYEYTYDANGNVTEVKNLLDTSKNVTYSYDGLNRLVKETNGARGSEWRYAYDNGGKTK